MYSALNVSSRTPEPPASREVLRTAWRAARSVVARTLRPAPAGAGSLLAAWRVLFAAACFVRLTSWLRLLDDLQDSYLFLPAAGWEWLAPPSPAAARAVCACVAACAALLAAGVLPRAASAALLPLCCYASAAVQDPASQLDSLVLQLCFANCLLPLASCWTVGGVLQRWASRHSVRRRGRPGDAVAASSSDAAPSPVRLWALVLLRFLLLKPYAQDGLAKLADGWNWLLRAQPAALRLGAITRGLPGAQALPVLISWTSCLLDCAVPPLLLHRPTRYTVGMPCVAVAQVINHHMWGMDGWWLLLAGGLLAWAPPEALEAAGRSFEAAAAWALAPRQQPQPPQPQQELWPSLQRQQPSDPAGLAAGGADVAAPLRTRAWSSWFWEGSGGGAAAGRHRRPAPSQQQQKQQQQPGDTLPSVQRIASRSGHGAPPEDGLGQAALVAVLAALAAYHLLAPLSFLAYPSRPLWTDEALIAPWHRHLADKRGWIYFVITEAAAAGGTASGGGGGAWGAGGGEAPAAGSAVAAPGGRVLDAAPEGDPMLGARGAALVSASPAAALRYAARLARVAAAGGRPAASVRALSCFSLNGGPYRTLFDATANLLPYAESSGGGPTGSGGSGGGGGGDGSTSKGAVGGEGPAGASVGAAQQVGQATAAAVAAAAADVADAGALPGRGARRPWQLGPASGVSQWLYDYDTAPRGCDPYASPRDRPGLIRRSRADLAEMQAAAGLWVEVAHDGARGGLRRSVCWDGGGGAAGAGGGGGHLGEGATGGGLPSTPCPMPAYMWQ